MGSTTRQNAPAPRQDVEAARSVRQRTALVAAAWSMAVTLVALVVVGMTVLGGDQDALADVELGPDPRSEVAGGRLGGGILRDIVGDELRPLLAEPIARARDDYRERAIATGLSVLVAVGAASGAAGWWYGGRQLRHAATVPPRGRRPGRPR